MLDGVPRNRWKFLGEGPPRLARIGRRHAGLARHAQIVERDALAE
jgi:hypothetical protein